MMNWDYIHAHWDWLGHILLALAMAGIITLVLARAVSWRMAGVIGLAFAVGHYHGREKRDFEISQNMPPPHLESFAIWNWSWDGATDFWPVAAVAIALGAILVRRS